MLLIPCPYCGERDESEFSYGGSSRDYPTLDEDHSIDDWYKSVYLPKLDQNTLREYWYHNAGCEQWVEVKRNLFTHEIELASSRKISSIVSSS